jgi:hypothetical protein
MSLLKWIMLAVVTLSMAACAPEDATTEQEPRSATTEQESRSATAEQQAQQPTVAPDAIDVESRLRALYGDLGGELRYFDAATDLNDDGQPEIIVYAYGPMLCGTGGCNTLVFTPDASGYRLVANISVSRPPIQAASRTTNGWRDLLVHVSGGGIVDGYDAELKFDRTSYPDNPTVAPAERARDTEGAEVLIPAFETFTDGKVVAAP